MELSHAAHTISEDDATQVSANGSSLSRAWLGLRAGIRLLLNPQDTQQVFLLAAAVDRPILSHLHAQLSAQPKGRALLRDRPAIDSSAVDYAALRALPEDSLGGAYARFLEREKLDPDLFQAPPGLPAELAFVAQRIRQSHDLWHVITGLGTDVASEVMLQAFSHGQLRNHTSRLIAVFGALVYGFRYPELRRETRRWYEIGKRTSYLLEVHWEELWATPLSQVRAQLTLVTH